jgi:hypothetical protein
MDLILQKLNARQVPLPSVIMSNGAEYPAPDGPPVDKVTSGTLTMPDDGILKTELYTATRATEIKSFRLPPGTAIDLLVVKYTDGKPSCTVNGYYSPDGGKYSLARGCDGVSAVPCDPPALFTLMNNPLETRETPGVKNLSTSADNNWTITVDALVQLGGGDHVVTVSGAKKCSSGSKDIQLFPTAAPRGVTWCVLYLRLYRSLGGLTADEFLAALGCVKGPFGVFQPATEPCDTLVARWCRTVGATDPGCACFIETQRYREKYGVDGVIPAQCFGRCIESAAYKTASQTGGCNSTICENVLSVVGSSIYSGGDTKIACNKQMHVLGPDGSLLPVIRVTDWPSELVVGGRARFTVSLSHPAISQTSFAPSSPVLTFEPPVVSWEPKDGSARVMIVTARTRTPGPARVTAEITGDSVSSEVPDTIQLAAKVVSTDNYIFYGVGALFGVLLCVFLGLYLWKKLRG